MESLRDRLRQKRVENSDSRYFLPEADLLDTLSERAIVKAVEECNVDFYKRDEILQAIMKGGRRLFAILILIRRGELISDFLENDQLHDAHTQLDSKLHFEKDMLERILVNAQGPNDVAEFYETQWEVLSPIFRNGAAHRTLHDKTILPYVETEELSTQGGFGVAWKAALHPTQQNLTKHAGSAKVSLVLLNVLDTDMRSDEAKVMVMRKEIRRSISKKTHASREEDRILSSLRCLKHPNIVKLLASYSLKGLHNLLFPLAYCDLHDLLYGKKPWPSQLQSPERILNAIHGLSRAIENVHSFFVDEFKVGFIGCHFDLKPKNVLVDEETFLLSDFGLSRLRPDDEDSKSLMKSVNGDYWAPECENMMAGFAKQPIGRSSDIWSFGCILAEIVAYLQSGLQGVKDLKGKRCATMRVPGIGDWTTHTFHTEGHLNPGAEGWVSELEQQSDLREHIKGLLRLIRQILDVKPDRRPTAKVVSKILFFIAQKSKFEQIKRKFDELVLFSASSSIDEISAEHGSTRLDLKIEHKRFEIWGQIVGFEHNLGLGSNEQDSPWVSESSKDFDRITYLLTDMDDQIYSLQLTWEAKILIPTYFQLRTLNDKLWEILPETSVREMESKLENSMLDTEDQSVLSQTGCVFGVHDIQNYKNIGILATLKYEKALFDEDKGDDGLGLQNPDQTHVQLEDINHELDAHSFGVIAGREDTPNQRFLIEWMPYKEIWDESVRKQLLNRARAIARLSNHANIDQPGLRILRCTGFYENTDLRAFGLLYIIPSTTTTQSKLITLKELVDEEGNRPILGDRFRLAHKIAYCLLEVHKVGWLHKNISGYNIAFFRPILEESSCPTSISSPYLIGFSHSRPNDPRILTEGVSSDRKKLQYQHPEYLRRGHGFCPVHDYYSVGLVLLEIGFWRSLDAIIPSDRRPKKLRAQERVEYLRKEIVPLLGQRMGAMYRDAVDACLNGDFPERGDNEIRNAFEAKVVNPLSRCMA